MKNLKRAERAVIALTVLCLVFTAGFFAGKSGSGSVITIEKMTNDSSTAAAASTPSQPLEGQIGLSASPDVSTSSVPYASASESEAPVTDEATPPTDAAKNTTAFLVNINTASAAELDSLPGIGDVLAGRIIEYRQSNSGFKSIEEIMDVSGIGEKKYIDIKDMITVG